jgi:hypothetical protein
MAVNKNRGFLLEIFRERDLLEGVGADGRINLKFA